MVIGQLRAGMFTSSSTGRRARTATHIARTAAGVWCKPKRKWAAMSELTPEQIIEWCKTWWASDESRKRNQGVYSCDVAHLLRGVADMIEGVAPEKEGGGTGGGTGGGRCGGGGGIGGDTGGGIEMAAGKHAAGLREGRRG